LLGWNHDTYFLDCFSKLFILNGSIVVEVEILKGFKQHLLFTLHAAGLLWQFSLQLFFKAIQMLVIQRNQEVLQTLPGFITYLAFKDWDIPLSLKFIFIIL